MTWSATGVPLRPTAANGQTQQQSQQPQRHYPLGWGTRREDMTIRKRVV